MGSLDQEAQGVMVERFGKDSMIALATAEKGTPFVRYVNAYYEDGAFYIITNARSNKMRHIVNNPVVAIAGDWFTAHGRAFSLGPFGRRENHRMAETLRQVFAAWIGNSHSDLEDENTVILRIELTDGLLLSHGVRYEF